MVEFLLLSPVPTALALVAMGCVLADIRARRREILAPAPLRVSTAQKRQP